MTRKPPSIRRRALHGDESPTVSGMELLPRFSEDYGSMGTRGDAGPWCSLVSGGVWFQAEPLCRVGLRRRLWRVSIPYGPVLWSRKTGLRPVAGSFALAPLSPVITFCVTRHCRSAVHCPPSQAAWAIRRRSRRPAAVVEGPSPLPREVLRVLRAKDSGFEPLDDGEEVTMDARKQAWARLLAKVLERRRSS